MPAEGAIHDYVLWAAQETYANPVYHLASILPVAAYEAATLGWGGPWVLPVRGDQGALQSFLVGDPTSAKSTALRKSMAFHEDVMRTTQGPLWTEGNNPWVMALGSVPGLLEACHARYNPELEITPAIMFLEEFSAMLDKGSEMIDVLMMLFDTVPRVERNLREYNKMRVQGQKPPSNIIKPAVGGVFCGTKSSAERVLLPAHFEGGLVSRSLWFSGKPDYDRHDTAAPDVAGRKRLVAQWTQLGRTLSGRRLRGEGSLLEVNAECKEILQPMFKAFCAAGRGGQEVLTAQLQRGMGMAKMIAGLYALSCGRTKISIGDMQAAVKLVELSQVTVTELAGLVVVDTVYKLYLRALRIIRMAGPGGITRARLNRNHLHANTGILDQTQALLEESGEVFITKRSNAGRPATIYIANEHLSADDKVFHFPKQEDPPEGE